MKRLQSFFQNIILAFLVLLLALQAFYLLVLELLFPQNTNIVSAYSMLLANLDAQGLTQSGEPEPQRLQELWPSWLVRLSPGGDVAIPYSRDNVGAFEDAVDLVEALLRNGERQSGGLGYTHLLASEQTDGLLLDLGRRLSLDLAMSLAQRDADQKHPTRRLLLTRLDNMLLLSTDGGDGVLYGSANAELLRQYQDCQEALASSSANLKVSVAGRFDQMSLYPPGAVGCMAGETPLFMLHTHNAMSLQMRDAVRMAFVFGDNELNWVEDEDGSVRYTENNSSLTLGSDGSVTYYATAERFGIAVQQLLKIELEQYTATEVIQAGYALFADCQPLGSYIPPEVGLRYMGANWQGDHLMLYYDYVAGGLSVRMSEPAMVLRYESGFFTAARIHLRDYQAAEQIFLPSPAPVAELASRQNGVGEIAFDLVYQDNGETEILPPEYQLTVREDS